MSASSRLLVSLLSFACVAMATSVGNYSFALFWPQSGASADADTLFASVFRPKLVALCRSNGVELPYEFSVTFTDFFLPSTKPTYAVLSSYAAAIESDSVKFTFAGTTSALGPDTLRLLRSVGDFRQLHWMEPLSLTELVQSLATVVHAIQLPPGVDFDTVDIEENRMLVVVIGPPYKLADIQRLLRSYEHGVLCFAIDDANIVANIEESAITTIMVLADRAKTLKFVYGGLEGALWSPDYRWILLNSGLTYEVKANLLPSNSRNITALEFGPYPSELAGYLKTTEQVLLHDLLDIWTAYMANETCNLSVDNQTLIGLTGRFRLSADGTASRQSWRMAIYRNLLTEAVLVGNISSNGAFNLAKSVPRSGAREDILNEYRKLNLNVYVIPLNQYVRYKKGMENAVDVPLRDRLEGMAFDLCMEVLDSLGLSSITVVVQPDMNYGTLVDGVWNGIVKSVVDGNADMACTDLTITNSRSRYIDFTTPFLQTNISILYKENKKDANKEMFQFMFPFSAGTWFYLCGALVLVAIVLTVLHRISPNEQSFDLRYSTFFSFASLVQGVVGHPPNRPSGRIVVTVYWLLVTLMLVAYVSNYAAMRSLEKLEVKIASIFSLTEQSAYTYGTLASSTIATPFQTSSFADLRLVYERMRRHKLGFFNDTLAAVAAVNDGKFAMIYDTPNNQFNQQRGCNLVVTGNYQTTDLAFGLPKRSDLRKLVNDELKKLLAKGRADELYKKYFIVPQSDRPQCDSKSLGSLLPSEPAALEPEGGALTLSKTFGLLVINVVGCLLTLLVAGAEYGYEVISASRRKSADKKAALDNRPRRGTISNILRFESET